MIPGKHDQLGIANKTRRQPITAILGKLYKLDVRLGTEYNRVSPRSESMQGGQPSCHQVELTQPTAEHTQDPWSGISSIGLFAPSNAQTYEPFPEDESAKKKKRKRRKGFSL